jgi:SAM-dependent methyltransferase
MLAPRSLPAKFEEWNRTWRAPYGRKGFEIWPLQFRKWNIRLKGPFGWQPNNTIRTFEYPWTYDAITRLGKNLALVELGGAVSGLQFVLAKDGHQVINVDPGLDATGEGWDLDVNLHKNMVKAFNSHVDLRLVTLDKANIPSQSVDVVISVSVLEHLSDDALESVALHINRILKVGGHLVLTADLFLDVQPFCSRESNRWGRNISLAGFLKKSGLELVEGKKPELCGFPEFSTDSILANLSDYFIGAYPCLSQCLVAKRI